MEESPTRETFVPLLEGALGRYREGEERIPGRDDPDGRQRQLTRLGNAANAAALCLLMLGRGGEARAWFGRAASRWRESFEHAPPGSWGRPIGTIKARWLAGDAVAAAGEARWALELGAAEADSPIGRYAGTLGLLTLGHDRDARRLAGSLRGAEGFPGDVADALYAIADGDATGYAGAVGRVLASFEEREGYLEGIPVADTVLVLQALASRRGLAAGLASPLLPA